MGLTVDGATTYVAPEGEVKSTNTGDQTVVNNETEVLVRDTDGYDGVNSGNGQNQRGDGLHIGEGGVRVNGVNGEAAPPPHQTFKEGMHWLQKGKLNEAVAEFQKLTDQDLSGVLTTDPADWPAAQETLLGIIENSEMGDRAKQDMRLWVQDQTALDVMGTAVIMPKRLAGILSRAAPSDVLERVAPERQMMMNVAHFLHRFKHSATPAVHDAMVRRLAMQSLHPENGDITRVNREEFRSAQQAFRETTERGMSWLYGVNQGVGGRAATAVFNAINQEISWPSSLFFEDRGQAQQFLGSVADQLGALGAYDIPGTEIGEDILGFGKDPGGVHHFHPVMVGEQPIGAIFHAKEAGFLPNDPRPSGARNFVAFTRDLEINGTTYPAGATIDAYDITTPEYKALLARADGIRGQAKYEELSFYQDYDEIAATFPRNDTNFADLWSFIDDVRAYTDANPAAQNGEGSQRDGLNVAGMLMAQTIDTFALDIPGIAHHGQQERTFHEHEQQFVFVDTLPDPRPDDARPIEVNGQTYYFYSGAIPR